MSAIHRACLSVLPLLATFAAAQAGKAEPFATTMSAALKAEIRTVEQMVGDWYFLREADKPLCRLTLSGDKGEGDVYRIVIKPGCNKAIAAFGLAAWRLDRDQLVLIGKAGTWRFSEAEPTTWERVPLTADPLLLVRQ